MTDFDTLENAALNRAVAEALGYILKGWQAEDDWYYQIGRSNDGLIAWQSLPDYASDLNAAIDLLDGIHYQLLHFADNGHYRVDVWVSEGVEKIYQEAISLSELATTVCRAWLKYQASQSS